MSSIWTDLLSLHGYPVKRDDLPWRDDGSTASQKPPAAPCNNATEPQPKRRLLPWPRLAAPH